MKDKGAVLALGGAALVIFYVLYAGRWNAGYNTPVPGTTRPGITTYIRPGTPGAPVSPLGQVTNGLQALWKAFGGSITPDVSSSTPAPIDSPSAGGTSLSDVIRTNMSGDLTLTPPDIVNGGVSGVTNDPGNPGVFFGADDVLFANAPAIDPASSFDAQSLAMAFT